MRPKGITYQSPRKVRLVMASMIEDYRNGETELERDEFKTLIWALSQILAALKLEKEIKIDAKYDEIIRRLEAKGL